MIPEWILQWEGLIFRIFPNQPILWWLSLSVFCIIVLVTVSRLTHREQGVEDNDP